MSPEQLATLFNAWISGARGDLPGAVERTVGEGLFTRADVVHALRALRNTVSETTLAAWLNGRKQSILPENVLVLHAGNIPLVGFQDVLAVLLSGHRYSGKFSKKDPYLPASFVKVVAEDFPDRIIESTLSVTQQSVPAQRIVFSGSEGGAQSVLEVLAAKRIVSGSTKRLMRTASFSVAWIPSWDEVNMADLTRAILQYGGNGCRSVAIVVGPEPLMQQRCAITDHAEAFWKTPVLRKTDGRERMYHAYYRAAGFPFLALDHAMLVQTQPDPSIPNTVFYVQGGFDDLSALLQKFGRKVQTVYSVEGGLLHGIQTEPLRFAQEPPVDWKPDGTDTLAWLLER
jgi:hypothetical protein